MAASVTAMYIVGSDLFYVHVGHGKGFLFREGHLVQLTTGHTSEQAKALEAERIGGPSDPRIDIEHIEVLPRDRLLLSTNGLTDAVSQDVIAGVLALRRRPADDCQRLVELARAAHASDDVTVLVADYNLQR